MQQSILFIYIVPEAILGFLSVIGNFLVIIAYFKSTKNCTNNHRTNYFVISLAFADFFVGLVEVPICIMVSEWILTRHLDCQNFLQVSLGFPHNQKYLCLLSFFFSISIRVISTYLIIALSIHRLQSVWDPIQNFHEAKKPPICSIAACILFGAMIGLLPLSGWYNKNWTGEECFFMSAMDGDYILFSIVIGAILVPMLALLSIYGSICVILLMSGKNSAVKIHRNEMHDRIKARQWIVTKNVFIIVGVHMVCGLPITIIHIMNFVRHFTGHNCFVNDDIKNVALVISLMNSVINPIIYACRIRVIREGLRILLSQCCSMSQSWFEWTHKIRGYNNSDVFRWYRWLYKKCSCVNSRKNQLSEIAL